MVATSNDETVITPLPRPPDSVPPPVAKKAAFPSASKWGRLVSSSLASSGTGSGNTQPTTPTETKPPEIATDSKASDGGGAVGVTTKLSRWGRLKSTTSEPRSSPTHAKLSKTASETGAAVVSSQKPDVPQSSAGTIKVHVTQAELNTAKPEAKQPETVVLNDLRRELHAVTEQMQRVEARLDIMFRMFTTFISASGLKAEAGNDDMMGVEVVDLTGGVVRRSPDPRSRGNSVDVAAASVFSSRLNSITSEDEVPVIDIPSNNTASTDATSTLSPPPPKPLVLGSPAKPPTLVRVRPLTGGQATAAVENPGFVASPDAHPGDADPARQVRKASSGANNAERLVASSDQRTVSAQPVTSVCKTPVHTTPTSSSTASGLATSPATLIAFTTSGLLTSGLKTSSVITSGLLTSGIKTSCLITSGLTTSTATVSGSSAPVARSTSVHERLSVGHLPASVSAPSAEGVTDASLTRSPPPPPTRRQSGAGSSPARGKQNDPRLRTTLV